MKRSDYAVPPAARSARLGLTLRELQVLCLLIEGEGAAAAAARLSLSRETVKGYCRTLYAKLNIRSRNGLAKAVISRAAPGMTFWTLLPQDRRS